MRVYLLFVLLTLGSWTLQAAKPLRVFFVDVEGGQATLIVTPGGQSLLIDTGWRGFDNRDTERIAQAAKQAGIKQIDYVLITHYHRDHVGGAPQLADRMKVGTFVDHGPNMEDTKVVKDDYTAYVKLLQRVQIHHMVAKPGDTIPLKGVKIQVLTSKVEDKFNQLPSALQNTP
jgi:beta-lactamase superfamily II metal-dependent hydrolase